MYDTITLRLETMNAEGCMSKLTETSEIIHGDTGEWRYRGKLQNLRVKGWGGGIWLTGSLPKFHLGSNIETLPREDTPRAIEHLSDELNQPMAEARVFRVDVAQTFAMERPPSDYWRCFLAPARMKRIEYANEDLTFRNRQRSIVFYDKLAEMRRKRAGSNGRPDLDGASRFRSQPHLLRYEVQSKRQLGRAFGEHEIRAASLSNPAFYEKVVGRWQAIYFGLERVSSVPQPVGRTTVKSGVNFLTALGLQTYGPQRYFDEVDADLHAGLIDKYQAHRLRKKSRELLRGGGITGTVDVLEELDTKVKQAVALCE
ncbi:MAG: phage/plasmid replication protein [Terriglobia bacterium]|jgi:hypothetical protein